MLRTTKARGALVALAASALTAPFAVPAHAASGDITDLASGLSGPLGLAISPEGEVYVSQSFGNPEEGVPSTLDLVGDDGELTTIASSSDGSIAGLDANARGDGKARVHYVTAGGTQDGPYAGLRWVRASGRIKSVADLQALEAEQNPDADVHYGFSDLPADCAEQVEFPPIQGGGTGYDGVVESNPYAVAVAEDGTRYVADAAGNTIIKVAANHSASTLAVLPTQPVELTQEMIDAINAGIDQGNEGVPEDEQVPHVPDCVEGHVYDFEPVPTDVEIGPDGWLYVSTLPGGPEDPSLGARGAVYKVHPQTGRTTELARGFFAATDLAVAPNGDIYVAELFGGQISKVGDDGPEPFVELPTPAAVEFAGGKLYATYDVFGPDGKVATIEP